MGMRTGTAIAAAAVFMTMGLLASSGPGKVMEASTARFTVSDISASEIIRPAEKDETVYALLNGDGSVRSIYVVNRVKAPFDGIYVDFGNYRHVRSLSEDIQPITEEGRVIWELKESYGDFYYQGELAEARLPWNFEIQYFLNGERKESGNLAGKSGKVEMVISVRPDQSAHPYFRNRFAIQIQVPVNLDRATVISDDGAVRTVTGRTCTLAYTVLPGTSASYRLVLEARNFEMDSISIGILAADYGGLLSDSSLTEGFDELARGTEDWAEGAKALVEGLADLSEGLDLMASGARELYEGNTELHEGVRNLSQGLERFSGSLADLASGSASLKDGFSGISVIGESVLAGYRQLAQGILDGLPGEAEREQLRMLAQYAGNPGSPYSQVGSLAQSLLDQIAGLELLYQNLSALNSSLEQYTSGVGRMTEEYKGIDEGIASLAQAAEGFEQGIKGVENGTGELSGGIAGLYDGVRQMSETMKEIPGHARELSDGAKSIKEGIDAAREAIMALADPTGPDEKPVSFADPENGFASSVQFVLRTPAIKAAKEEKEAPEITTEKKSFWQKLIELLM